MRVPGWMLIGLTLAGCAHQPVSYEATTRLPLSAREQASLQLIVTIHDADPSFATATGVAPGIYGEGARYHPSPYAQRITRELARDHGLQWVAAWRIDVLGVHCVVFSAPDVQARTRAIEALRRDRRVESVQPMQQFHASAVAAAPAPPPSRKATYNDPYYGLQRQVEAMRIPQAQRWSQGRGVRVAVVDTGVDLQHPDLVGRVKLARNFVDDDNDAFSRDAHGTAVAGSIAALANNGVGIVGVAPGVQLLALKACWHEKQGEPALCNSLTLAEALAFAIEQRAAVINLSLSGPADPLLNRLVEVALRRGTVVIGADVAQAHPEQRFPLGVSGVLSVADGDAVAARDSRTQLAAPGREVLTLAPNGRYDYVSGASLATAMVSGIVALLLERRPGLAPAEVAALLERTAGASRVVDACGAMTAVVSSAKCEAGSVAVVQSKEPM